MIQNFSFQNVCGTFYYQGDAIFKNNQNHLISPIGNRVKVIDLELNKTWVLDFQTRSNISKLAINNTDELLLAIDNDGYAIIFNLNTNQTLNYLNFKGKVKSAKFSQDGKFLAVAIEKKFRLFLIPDNLKLYQNLQLFKKFKGQHSGDITFIDFSPDSRFIITGSADLTVQIHAIHHIEFYSPFVFQTHKQKPLLAFFSTEMDYFFTCDQSGCLNIWKWVEDYLSDAYKKFKLMQKNKIGKKIKLNNNTVQNVDQDQNSSDEEDLLEHSDFEKKVIKGRFILHEKIIFPQVKGTRVKSFCFHKSQKLLITGFKNGQFVITRIDQGAAQELQNFHITEDKINSISVSSKGNWIAFGISYLGQLIVWEWRSQTFILNQQSSIEEISVADYSQDGSVIATGSLDGKVKLWDTKSFFCFSIFSEHLTQITGLKFSSRPHTLISASLDGTVRCYDTAKYKTFRVLKPDVPTQLTCLAIDQSGEMVFAAGKDPYDVYCWNIQTGNLIDVITGHESVISALGYSQNNNLLISGSWDKTVRAHEVYNKKLNNEIMEHNSEVTAIAVRSDGKEICVATFKGELYFWDPEQGQVIGVLDCKKDVQGGRLDGDFKQAKNSVQNKHFTSVQYSSDGEYVLAGGNSKYLCIYEVKHRILVKKIVVTSNRSLDGVFLKLNSKNVANGGVVEEEDSDYEKRKDNSLPGSNALDLKRKKKQRVQVKDVKMSPSQESWSVCTNEGLFLYGQRDKNLKFNPIVFSEGISVENCLKMFQNEEYLQALIMALHIDDKFLIGKVQQAIPTDAIQKVVIGIPKQYVITFIECLSNQVENSNQVEQSVIWIKNVLFYHSDVLNSMSQLQMGQMKRLIKSLNIKFKEIKNITENNVYKLDYLSTAGQFKSLMVQEEAKDEIEN